MIKIKVNGEECEIAHGISIAELLEFKNYEIKYIAVEHNGSVIMPAAYEQTILCEGDKIEIVRFVGGG